MTEMVKQEPTVNACFTEAVARQMEAEPGVWFLVRTYDKRSSANALMRRLKKRGLEATVRMMEKVFAVHGRHPGGG